MCVGIGWGSKFALVGGAQLAWVLLHGWALGSADDTGGVQLAKVLVRNLGADGN